MGNTVLALITPLICCSCFKQSRRRNDKLHNYIFSWQIYKINGAKNTGYLARFEVLIFRLNYQVKMRK